MHAILCNARMQTCRHTGNANTQAKKKAALCNGPYPRTPHKRRRVERVCLHCVLWCGGESIKLVGAK